jgi:hypothetical protein
MSLCAEKEIIANEWYFLSDFHYVAPDAVRLTVFCFTSTWPQRWCHMNHSCHASTDSLEARLRNPSLASFQVKQAAKSRRVSNTIFILPSVLWHNREIIARLLLRPKPRNHHGDFMSQIIKPQLPILRSKPENPSTLVLRPNQEIHAPHLFMHRVDRT